MFISSHLMSEMAVTADHLIVIGRGRILADCSMNDFMADHAASYVRVKSPALTDVEEPARPAATSTYTASTASSGSPGSTPRPSAS